MVQKEDLIADLKNRIIKSEKNYPLDVIDRAISMACEAHKDQHRALGEEYACHPLAVAAILVDLGMDLETIVAGILHDVVEDTRMELADVEKQFGPEIAKLVDGVTKITKMPFSTKEEQQAENVRKMLLAMSQDIRVIIIKLADRLHNMRTSEGWDEQKRRDKAKETMDIYAPLAHRLGISAVKEELEDLSLRILDSVGYREIEEALALREHDRKAFLQDIQNRIAEQLAKYGIKPFLSGRVKSIYGIYRKMFLQNRTFDEIYDIYAVRIIVDTVNDCYNVLGIIHDMFRPLPNRFKDYISTPKPNMYQSLHTTVISKEKIPFEVQIRTWEMHYTAEYGIAAHWKYKLGIQKKDSLEERLAWIRQFIENQKDLDDAEDIVQSIKTDLSSEEVFVFTPKGDVITLPVGSTVIDFAYAIHSEVGNRMVGAKVDGRIESLDYQLKTGEVVEIITTSSMGKGPSRDWLNIVKTSEARNKIRNWFKNERRDENIAQGKAALERELSRFAVRLSEEKLQELLMTQARRHNYNTLEDFYAAIGYGGVQLSRVMARLKDEYVRIMKAEGIKPEQAIAQPRRTPRKDSGVIVENMDDCLVKFARCCNPLPGDRIIGFITRGYGVSIHKIDCKNVPRNIAASPEPERWVACHWAQSVKGEYKAALTITASDRLGLLADLTTQLASMRVMIYAINTREIEKGHAEISLTVGVNSLEHLQAVNSRLLRIPGVEQIKRG